MYMEECLSVSLNLASNAAPRDRSICWRENMNQQPDMSSVPLKTEHVVLMAIGTGASSRTYTTFSHSYL